MYQKQSFCWICTHFPVAFNVIDNSFDEFHAMLKRPHFIFHWGSHFSKICRHNSIILGRQINEDKRTPFLQCNGNQTEIFGGKILDSLETFGFGQPSGCGVSPSVIWTFESRQRFRELVLYCCAIFPKLYLSVHPCVPSGVSCAAWCLHTLKKAFTLELSFTTINGSLATHPAKNFPFSLTCSARPTQIHSRWKTAF